MIDKFLEEGKKELNDTFKALIIKLGKRYDEFWQKMIKDLTEKKFTLEQTIVALEKAKKSSKDNIQKIATELIDLTDSLKKKKDLSVKYDKKNTDLLNSILKIEDREAENVRVKQELAKKEDRLNEKEMAQNLRKKVLNERELNINRLYTDAKN